MNCQEFEGLLPLLGRGPASQDNDLQVALSHAKSCRRCSARLADERALVEGLNAIAGESKTNVPPAHLETALLKAFREAGRRTLPSVPENAPPSAGVDSRAFQAEWKRSLKYAGLAASVLLLLGWIAARPLGLRKEESVNTRNVPTSDSPRTASPNRVATGASPLAGEVTKVGAVKRKLDRKIQPRSPVPAPDPVRRSKDREGLEDREIRTAFIPFMAVEPLSPSELRQLVRIRLPRSAVQVFGLPVNMERSREPVEADVLVGEDGRALAVRFVKE